MRLCFSIPGYAAELALNLAPAAELALAKLLAGAATATGGPT